MFFVKDFGPELNFARNMSKDNPNRNIYIIKYFSSGKALDSGWDEFLQGSSAP